MTSGDESPPEPGSDDLQLIAALNEGDEAAFGVLYERYAPWVFRNAWRMTGHEDDANDVLQDVFSYLLSKFPGFNLTCRMTTFLYPAVRNLSIAARKRRHKHVSDDVPEFFAAAEHSAAPEAVRQEWTALFAALSPEHREVVLLRFLEGFSLSEISEAVNTPLGTVKSRLHHALALIREHPRIIQALRDAAK